VDVYAIPLYFFAAGIPIYGIILTILRLGQSDKQLTEVQKQYAQSKINAIEHSFFKLIELHSNYVENLKIPGFGQHHQGKDTFSQLHSNFHNIFHKIPWNDIKDKVDAFTTNYIRFLSDSRGGGTYLDIYINNLHNILRHIHNNREFIDISTYTNIVRSQLSKYECYFIVYHAVSNFTAGFAELVREYAIARNIDKSEILNVQGFDPYALVNGN